ncbi:hypothetical protein SAMN05518684_104131 [Salipaludibacillus aurantiacus]|uniref:Uncharacterized protein n=1 Tax=Salipaludibacillus aurantiacus TaxID=1601833 RepID=A0A1H9SB98_9BACI|nr:hypothetical protein SAMN05518684_104131 [Salipaludibacillus aurantiacus]
MGAAFLLGVSGSVCWKLLGGLSPQQLPKDRIKLQPLVGGEFNLRVASEKENIPYTVNNKRKEQDRSKFIINKKRR